MLSINHTTNTLFVICVNNLDPKSLVGRVRSTFENIILQMTVEKHSYTACGKRRCYMLKIVVWSARKIFKARNLGHRVSCDLHSGCHAMILTAGFHNDSGLKLFVKIEWSNTTMFMVK